MERVQPNPYRVELLKAVPPPVQREGNNTQINFSLTLQEIMLLGFIENTIRSALNGQNDLIYLGTSAQMQRDFSTWVEKSFKNKQFSPEELKLDAIVSSVWGKSKTFTINELILRNNQEGKTDEEKWQKDATAYSTKVAERGLSGKFFTNRQVILLVKTVEDIAKSHAESKK